MSLRIKYNNAEINKIVVTLQEDYDGVLPLSGTYSLMFKTTNTEYTADVIDISPAPTEFNIFNITTEVNSANTQNFPIQDQGWCDYSFLYNGETLETGKCYVADSDDVENKPDGVYTYENVITKYVYNKDKITITPPDPPVDEGVYITTDSGTFYTITSGQYITI